jgi:hypothetical protein
VDEIIRQHMHSQARGLILRALFAWMGLTIFTCGVFGIWWPLAVILMSITLVTISLMVWRDVGVSVFNLLLITPTIKTNNRWLAWMAGLTSVTLILLFFTPVGGNQLQETIQGYTSAIEERRERELDERMNNALKHGRYVTDAEFNNKPEKPISVGSHVPQDYQREKWKVRATCFVILFVLTFFYLFFAFWDEAQDAFHSARVKLKEKAEGDVTKAVVNASLAAAPVVATKGASLVQDAAQEVSRQLAWDAFTGFIERVWRRGRR